MAMRKIPQDTDVFKFNNPNPKNNRTTDCVVRAIALATHRAWGTVYREMFEFSFERGRMVGDATLIDLYLKHLGWVKHPSPRRPDNHRYRGYEFCREYIPQHLAGKTIIANIGAEHIVAIIDGRVNDIWNSTNGAIGNYWTLP